MYYWYKPATMFVEAFLPPIPQSIETGVEEIRIQVAKTLIDNYLCFNISLEMMSS